MGKGGDMPDADGPPALLAEPKFLPFQDQNFSVADFTRCAMQSRPGHASGIDTSALCHVLNQGHAVPLHAMLLQPCPGRISYNSSGTI